MMEKITLEEIMEDIRAVEHKLRLLRGKDMPINLPMTKSADVSSPQLAILDEMCADAITHITSIRCRFRTISNSFKTIHRLPLEVLSEIFALVPTRRSSYPRQSYDHIYGSGIGPVSHLVPLTEVCHLWRDILHQDPRFWSEVEDRGGAQLGAPTFTHYIHRNTTGPLYVKILSASPSKETRLLLEHSGSRIRELHIYNWGQGQSDSMPSLSSISAHQLRSCKIDCLIDGSKRTTSLFKGYAPRLRFLWLNCVAIPSNAFPSLTNLLIEWPGPALMVRHFPFAELIAFLQGCPSLREVHLASFDVISQVSPLLPDVRSRDLVMPRLRKLSIIGWRRYRDASLHLAICSRLSLPADCLLYMAHIPPTRLREVLDVLVASARRERPFTRLMVTRDTDIAKPAHDCFTLQMVDSRSSMGIRVDVNMEEGFDRYYPSRRIRLPSERRSLCAALSNYPLLSDIQLLHLSGDDVHVLGGAWSTLLHSTFSSLTSLVVVEPYDQDALRLVLQCSNGADAAPRMPCPQLRTLTIRTWPQTDLTFLPSLLASRAHAGYPLHQLSLVLRGAVLEGSIVEDVDVLNRLAEFVEVFDVHCGEQHVGIKGPLGPEPSPWSALLPLECTSSEETYVVFWPKWS